MITNEILATYPKVYDGEFCTIYDMRQEISHTSLIFWKGFYRVESPIFQKDMKYSLNYIQERRIKVVISDHSLLKVVTPDVLTWLHANWYATAAKNGLRVEAALEAQDIFAKATLGKCLKPKKSVIFMPLNSTLLMMLAISRLILQKKCGQFQLYNSA